MPDDSPPAPDRKDPTRRGASFNREEAEVCRRALARYHDAKLEAARELALAKFERMAESFDPSSP